MGAVDERAAVRHYAKTSMGDALCGADYPRTEGITAWQDDTTCPRCLGLLEESPAGGQPPVERDRGSTVAVDLARVLADHQHWANGAGAGEHAAVAVLLHASVHGPLQELAPVLAGAVDQDGDLDWDTLTSTTDVTGRQRLLLNTAASLFRGGVDQALAVNLGELPFLSDAEYDVFTAMLQAARNRAIPAGYR